MRSIYTLRYVLLAFLFVSGIHTTCCAPTGSSVDPYKIFGVDRDVSQDEIRSRYRKLCLKYHPDKNVGKSVKERKRCTHYFKQIQEANALIGDAESRRSYEWRSKFAPQTSSTAGGGGGRFPRHAFNSADVDAFYRSFTEMNPGYRPRRRNSSESRSPFGFDTGKVFSSGPLGKATSMFRNGSSLKSTFVQKIKVPLQDLYNGRPSVDFEIQDNPWKSYSAAFRGGFGYLILYQSLIFSAPLLRLSRLATLIVGAVVFHMHVPRPSNLQFTADIASGYKEGTKIIFRDDGFDTMFVLEEEKHDRFKRVGNDLHTNVEILACQAKTGCTVEIELLNPVEPSILVKLEPNEINQSNNNTVTVKGKGWPIRKTGEKGDLVVKFVVVQKLSRRKRKKSKKKK